MSCSVIKSLLLSSLFIILASVSVYAADSVCVQCHSQLTDNLGAPVPDWQTSVHAENGISCHDCHGGDPTDMAMAKHPDRGFVGAPEYTEIPEFCGKCHVGVYDAYSAGAHGQALEKGGAQCVTCHGNHAIQNAGLDLINEEDCSQCHSYERAALIRLALVETDEMIQEVEGELERLYRLGFAIDEMQSTVFNQRNVFHRTFHGVNVDKVRKETGGVQTELGKIKGQIAEIDRSLGQRKLWGSVVIGLFVLAGIILFLVRKAYEEEEGH